MKKHSSISRILLLGLVFMLAGLFIPLAEAQYFGRNKPGYRTFDFRVFQSPNFEIYHYFENDSVAKAIANLHEKWFIRHNRIFNDSFPEPNPILMYANHPDFQQTTAVSGAIGVGTQGVTEALRNRVVMPVLETNAQTDHVIGHELVHVFQFRQLFERDSLSLNSLRNLPLWLVEGMAEYLSIGSVDAHTAMIMRDAIHRDDFPTLNDMTRNYRYNPYRYGHAFVAFFGRTWGDTLIGPLFSETAKFGYERALERVIGLGASTVSTLWKSSMQTHYEPLMADSARHVPVGEKLVSSRNAGEINISPSLSPDGNLITFFSERDLISIDLFLADAHTGRIKRRLTSSSRTQDVDGFNFFESVGTWSPDGDKFVYVIVKRGVNKLVIADVNRPRRSREVAIPGVPSVNNPVWSPDGSYLVFTGLTDGRPNMFKFDLETEEVTMITNDRFSYVHPSWSPDGRYLVFATDRPQTTQADRLVNFRFNLGMIDMEDPNRSVRVFDIFPEADNLNPVFDHEQSGFYFLSNRDGYRNLYFLELESLDVFQLTDFYTGISGITHLSPAISVSRHTGEVVYSHFQDAKYTIHKAQPEDFERKLVDPFDVDMTAATLPPFQRASRAVVDAALQVEPEESIFPVDSFVEKPYRPRFELSFIGSSGVGVATNRFGTGVAGGVSMMFTDITGENQMFAAVAVNGEIYDFGAQVGYLNQRRRINWGGMISHIPYPFAYLRLVADTMGTDQGPVAVDNLQLLVQRTFEDQFAFFAYYPFSTTRRLELTTSLAFYYFRIDAINNYYIGPYKVGESRERLEAPSGFNLQRVNLAYVGDNSYFGMASPIRGQRYRLGAEKFFGRVDMVSVTADYRRYEFLRPFTLAFRAVHYGRYGREPENDLFYPLYLGYPGFVRGYDYGSLTRMDETFFDEFTFDQLLGSKVMMGGLEVRLPFTGPERLAIIPSNLFFTELTWFLDAGVAWSSGQQITLDPNQAFDEGKRFPVFSTGPSLRVNLFGALILEPFYAFPFHTNGIKRGVLGLNFLPGW
jgi:hypothetical protein